ncbi:hypothetical protein VTI74DRAFT_3788 [Chaetomium olivicolor]
MQVVHPAPGGQPRQQAAQQAPLIPVGEINPFAQPLTPLARIRPDAAARIAAARTLVTGAQGAGVVPDAINLGHRGRQWFANDPWQGQVNPAAAAAGGVGRQTQAENRTQHANANQAMALTATTNPPATAAGTSAVAQILAGNRLQGTVFPGVAPLPVPLPLPQNLPW